MQQEQRANRILRIMRTLYSRFSRSELQKEIRHLGRLVERVLANQKQDEKWRMIFRRQLNALIRRDYIANSDLAAPRGLAARRFRLRSQNEEDGLILALLHAVGVTKRRFVEIGCGGSGGNSAVLARELGWTGLMIDSSRKAVERLRLELRANPSVNVIRVFMTPECINDVLREHGAIGDIDFLSIDVDSTDYWHPRCAYSVFAQSTRYGIQRVVWGRALRDCTLCTNTERCTKGVFWRVPRCDREAGSTKGLSTGRV